jgi:hypothetical protein
MAVAEHVNSLAVLAEGFSLRPDVPLSPDGHATELVAPVEAHAAGAAVRGAASLDDDGLVELGAAVMHFVAFNTVAHGMMLEPPFTDL